MKSICGLIGFCAGVSLILAGFTAGVMQHETGWGIGGCVVGFVISFLSLGLMDN